VVPPDALKGVAPAGIKPDQARCARRPGDQCPYRREEITRPAVQVEHRVLLPWAWISAPLVCCIPDPFGGSRISTRAGRLRSLDIHVHEKL